MKNSKEKNINKTKEQDQHIKNNEAKEEDIREENNEAIKLTKELEEAFKKIEELNKELSLWEIKYEDYGKQMQIRFNQRMDELDTSSKVELNREKQRIANEVTTKVNGALGKIFADVSENVLNISRAVLNVPETASNELKNYAKGFGMLINSLERILTTNGLEIIHPKINDSFDPASHQAVSKIHQPDATEGGTIIGVMTPQYCLHGKTISYAKVKVATNQK